MYMLDPLARRPVDPTPPPPLRYPKRAGIAKLMAMDTPADTPAHAPSRVGEMAAAAELLADPTPAEGVGVCDGDREGVGVCDGDSVGVGLEVGDAKGVVLKVNIMVGVGGMGVQSVWPALLVVPVGQGAHTAEPLSFEKKLTGHTEQADASEAPTEGLNVPGLHKLQASRELHVPAGQGGPHTGEPGGVSDPAEQGVQVPSWGCEAVPAGQIATLQLLH